MKQRLLVALSLIVVLGLTSCTGVGSPTRPGTHVASGSAEQSNPPIQVTLDKIGVHHNGESGFRAVNPAQSYANILGPKKDARDFGEVYIHLVVTDGKATTEMRLPAKEGEYYLLKPDDVTSLNKRLLYTSEVGDTLTIAVIGYEEDGEGFEKLVYRALDLALGNSGGVLESFNVNLRDLVGRFTGEKDDFMGSYEETFTEANNWGIGSHYVPCAVDGETRLRLWFTIDSPD